MYQKIIYKIIETKKNEDKTEDVWRNIKKTIKRVCEEKLGEQKKEKNEWIQTGISAHFE